MAKINTAPFFYELLYLLGLLIYLPKGLWRRRLPHRGWSMRLGRYPAEVLAKLRGPDPVWIHAVSVGEVLALRPLVRALRQASPAIPLVLSTVTAGGFEVASKTFGGEVVPIYWPLDLGGCARRALEAVHPRALLLTESELWPTVLRQANARRIPVAVINGRLSPRAFRRYRLAPAWTASVLAQVDLLLMQHQDDADRLLALGAPKDRVRVAGNLKWEASLDTRPSPEAVQATAARIAAREADLILIGGSTHRGEEAALLSAWQRLRKTYPTLRLILAPRHLERLDEVEHLARRRQAGVARLSDHAPRAWDIGLVDTFGRLPEFYALSTVVFVGGSLIPHGGQNPLEAAGLGKPVVFGPSMHNFEAIAQALLEHQAARPLAGTADLARVVGELFADRAQAEAMGRRAQQLVEASRGTTQRLLDSLRPLLA